MSTCSGNTSWIELLIFEFGTINFLLTNHVKDLSFLLIKEKRVSPLINEKSVKTDTNILDNRHGTEP
jgi:hypothetical protein